MVSFFALVLEWRGVTCSMQPPCHTFEYQSGHKVRHRRPLKGHHPEYAHLAAHRSKRQAHRTAQVSANYSD